MTDRQSSSHNDSRSSEPSCNNDKRNLYENTKYKAPSYAVTNRYFEEEGMQKPVKVVFCKYNPLHVVAITLQWEHEHSECPDREWNPGDKVLKYKDVNCEVFQ